MQDKIQNFFEGFNTESYNKGEVIIFANMNLKSVYYIESGTVIEYDIAASGSRAILNSFKPGAFFPISNAINQIDTPYFYEASSPVIIRKAPAMAVIDFLKNNPDVTYDLLKRVYSGMDGVLARLSAVMQGDAESRVLKEIEIIKKRFGYEVIDNGAEQLVKKVPEKELAERTGLARETVSRAIKKLKTSGRLKVQKGFIVVTQSK